MALLSLAHQECGSQDLACETLGELILKAEPEGHVRLFINEGNKMRALLLETLRREPKLLNDASIKRFIDQVLDAFESSVKYKAPVDGLGRISRTDAKDAPIERLSGREVQVLRLIADGKSYENVADELIVALSTIQWHVKNIYRKLNAHSGTEAVAIARKLGILSE